jgi:transcription elongation factor Elf1
MIKICPYCGDYFSDKLLDMHMSVCTKKKEMEAGLFICDECGEQFTEKSAFSAHKDIHQQKEPIK